MATNLSIINDALSLLGVLTEGQDATAEQGEHGLRSLNDMLAGWDVDIGYFPQTETSEDWPCDYRHAEAVKYALAVRLAPHYGRSVSPELASVATVTYGRLLRNTMVAAMEASDPILPLAEGSLRGSYSVLTGN